jgi:two-component system, LuxR family, response regulator FixJ
MMPDGIATRAPSEARWNPMVDHDRGVVAIVDDDVAVVESLKFLLEAAGQEVVAYTSATAFLGDSDSHPRCLIVDYHMPHMTGLDLTARLRTEGSVLPILLVTGLSSPAIVERAAELGVSAVLEKPIDEATVLSFVEQYQ